MTIFLRRVNETAVKQGVLPDPLQGTVGAVSAEKYFESLHFVGDTDAAINL